MKDLEEKKIDKPEVVNQRQVESQKLISRWNIHPGHKVWELNIKEGLIREAKIEEVTVQLGKLGPVKRSKVIQKDGCLYCSALNANNADKRFMKMLAVHTIIKNYGAGDNTKAE